ncbi:SusC/RagA family TonB-linked outer membrane protein [Aquiflexum sp.]|uniref:SusC/RagA family TonB-linked outer membrane protein n=1 Tax=Aquiflexum sp. TaxID=1872584 RepID=UPI0035940789
MEKLYKSLGILTMLILFSSATVLAQRTVSGTVLDEAGLGLPGVTVLNKGTNSGTATDIDGNFSLNVLGNDNVLIFSFVGYHTKEETVGNRSIIEISLAPDFQTLTEMVVTGYAVQQKKDITGAVGVVKGDLLNEIPAANVENQLQGRLAGVSVISSGNPGAGSSVRIRGLTGFGNNNPLYVVDGVQTFDISTLSPNDIESISVLKDAGAASIYGSRASNGVVLITTKKGKSGSMKVTYHGYGGFQDPGKGFTNLLNTQEFANLQWQVLENGPLDTFNHPLYGQWTRGGAGPRIPDYILPAGAMEGDPRVNPDLYNLDLNNPANNYLIVRANKEGTDWFQEATRPALITNHDFMFSGGGDRSRYMAALNYFEQQGILIETFSKRYSMRFNSEFDVSNKVRIGENLQVSFRQNRQANNLSEGNGISSANRIQRIIPVYDIAGNFAGNRAPNTGNGTTSVAMQLRQKDNDSFDLRVLGNIYAEADITEDLVFRSTFGGSLQTGYYHFLSPQTWERSENQATSSFTEGAWYNAEWLSTNQLTYQKTFGVHAIKAVAGYEAVKAGIGRDVSGNRAGYFSLNPDFLTLGNGQNIVNATSSANTFSTLLSQFLRVDYGYADKYLLSATVRRDGSSRFRDQFGVFPSFTGAWRMSEEGFMKGSSTISELKIRAGWGVMGQQQRLDPANQFTLFGGNIGSSFYDIAGTNTGSVLGQRPVRIGNPDARWERNVTTNVGVDLSLWEDKLSLTLDLYNRISDGLLFAPPLPATAGAASGPSINLAEMVNKGIDFQATYRNIFANGLRFETDLIFTHYTNEILSIADGVNEFFAGGSRIGNLAINRVGHPLSAFFGYQVQGLFQNQEEVNNAPRQDGAAPGRFRFTNFTGVDDDGIARISANDRVVLGSPIPDFTAGMNFSLSLRNWDMSAFFFASVGNDIYNYNRWWTDFWPSFQGAKSHDALYNSWLPSRPNATTPIAENASNFSTNTQSNSYYIEDGSYLRFRNLTIGYTLPTTLVQRWRMERLRIYAQGVNLFTLTGYSGLDPELGGSDQAFGIDYGNYPIVKQFILGLNVNF